ncbi:TPA: helix-turn-helix domain-containing protein [Klebsiella pneumoniae]|uniref:helix-turn-helix domain-containing protein n=1 Tax=Klebsiella pneumoniae complex TaxID=3390273 RepID=UPI0008134E71|nr:helix-turn-helix domain-containing protein [Klebsiella pneumoniae]EIX9222193.1 helix-turn-helix domain-containing protein [Klebsiella pneumoniae]EIX9527382.1 helix-turn-helix domain-containing protein [Klebsiella pneumoniae]MBK2658341.1 helix-turn-helix domain-containing protein [Klebsiella pneumoniae]HBS6131887.1 helix-turn-helix domain-containing protein [Klebsiella pneumoniae]HBS6477467.1 helix-turn-helix domain-containing protein [Klebsiella pneumoniae]
MSKQSQNLLNLTQAAEAVGITRKTLYSHIDKGLVSVTRQQGKRYVDVSELIRHYGSVSLPEEKVNTVTRSQTKHDDDAISAMQRELVELRKLIEKQQLLLEDKQEADRLREQMTGLQNERDAAAQELEKVKAELEAERKKGFFGRLFSLK